METLLKLSIAHIFLEKRAPRGFKLYTTSLVVYGGMVLSGVLLVLHTSWPSQVFRIPDPAVTDCVPALWGQK